MNNEQDNPTSNNHQTTPVTGGEPNTTYQVPVQTPTTAPAPDQKPVMPATQAPTDVTSAGKIDPEIAGLGPVSTDESSTSAVAPAPVEEGSANEGNQANTQTEAQPTAGDTNANPMAIPSQSAEHHSGMPKGAIIAAILIALLLIAGAVYAYLKTNEIAPVPTTTTQQTEQAAPAANDVDEAERAIDESVNGIDENSDFSDSDLSDESLGL